jgi:benzoate transport
MDLTEAIRRNPMSRYQWLIVGLCIVLTMIDGYEILISSYTLPALTEHWSLDKGQQGLVASIGTLGIGVGAVGLSPLADRIGRRPLTLAALVVIVVSMTLGGLAQSFDGFLAFRFFAGLGLGAIIASISVLVSEYANADRRGLVMGIYGIGLPLGAALGGFLSSTLIDAFSWRGPFFFSAILTAVVAVAAFVALPESVSFLVQRRRSGDLATYNRIAARMGVAAATELPAPPARTREGGFVRQVFSGSMLPRTLLLWISYATLIAAFYFANGLTAKLVTETTGNPDFGIRAQAMVAAGGILGALAFGLLARRIPARLVTGMIMAFGVIVFFAFAAFFTDKTMVLILAVLVGFAVNGGVAAYYGISPSIYPVAIRAAAVGLMMGVGRIVAFFAPNIATFLQEHGFTPEDLYRLYGGVLVVSAIAVTALHLTYRGSKDAMDTEAEAAEAASAAVEVPAH